MIINKSKKNNKKWFERNIPKISEIIVDVKTEVIKKQ